MLLRPRLIRVLVGVAATAFAATSSAGAAIDSRSPGPIRMAPDRIEVGLAPAAARSVWYARVTAGGGATTQSSLGTPLAGASLATDVALSSFGISALDRALVSFGVVAIEPEFRGELPPGPADDATDFTAFYIVRWSREVPVEQIVTRLRALPEVASADPIPLLPVSVTPNDSTFAASYWFQDLPLRHDVAAPEAWDVTTGDSAIVVGVLDTGVVPYHPDLGGAVAGYAGQIWTNVPEADGVAGIDDDGNGFIDDAHGWDFLNRPPDGVATGEDYADQDPDPNDMAGHGTAVAGVVGALTNNTIGVAGTAWNVRVMPLRIGWSAMGAPLGLVDMSAVAQALRYAARMNVPVVNCSFATLNLTGLFAAASAATRAGVVIVSAAGNDGQPHDLAGREDVIAVAATRPGDVVASFSNLGPYVDLAAPGAQIATTFARAVAGDSLGLRQPSYVVIDGTSFASPMVAGGAALVQSQRLANGRPLLNAQGMLLRLTETSDDISAQNVGTTGYGAGRLNLHRALTDRPTSTASRAGATALGSALIVWPNVAYAMQNQRLMIKSGQNEDTLLVQTLPGVPIGLLAGGATSEFGSSMFVGTANGWVAGFQPNGTPMSGWPVSTGSVFARPRGGPAMGDLNGDGQLEVVCATENGQLHAWQLNSDPVENFPLPIGIGGVPTPVAIADLDADGRDEIVTATFDGEISVVRGDASLMTGWPIYVNQDPQAPVVTRFAPAESPVIVVAASDEVTAFRPDGTTRFSLTLPGLVTQAPALGDLDGDGVDEIILALDTPAIAVVDSAGALVGGAPFSLAAPANGPPLVGPITLNGREIVIFEGNDLAAFAVDGARRGPFPKPGHAGFSATLVDIDGDGATEITAGTGPDSILYVYDAGPGGWTDTWRDRTWLTHRGDPERTGSRDVGPPSAVADLRVSAVTESTITLQWSSAANEDASVRAVDYEVRGQRDTLTAGGWDTSPTIVLFTATVASRANIVLPLNGFERGTQYAFALRATDAAGNVSAVSNIATGTASLGGPLANHPGPGIAPARRPSGRQVELYWRGENASTQHITIFDVLGRKIRTIPLPSGPEGIAPWDGRDDDGLQVSAGVYFVRLTSGASRVQTRVVLLP